MRVVLVWLLLTCCETKRLSLHSRVPGLTGEEEGELRISQDYSCDATEYNSTFRDKSAVEKNGSWF